MDEDVVRFFIRWTGKLSTTLFLIAFGVSSFHHFTKDRCSKWVLQKRGNVGLAFGTMHTFHLLFLILLQMTIHPVFEMAKTTSLIGGGTAYGFMFLMMITTFSGPKRMLSTHQWKWLHTIGGYWIWTIFFLTYLKRVQNENYGYLLLSLLVFVLITRLAYLFSTK